VTGLLTVELAWVTPRLAVTTGPHPSDARLLVEYGVTHLLDLREANENPDLRVDHPRQRVLWHPRLEYAWNPTPDDGRAKPVEWFAKSLQFTLAALTLPAAHVAVACSSAIDRAPATAYATLRALGLDRPTAETLILKAQPEARPLAYQADADVALSSLGYL
jgi:hypothetical protein